MSCRCIFRFNSIHYSVRVHQTIEYTNASLTCVSEFLIWKDNVFGLTEVRCIKGV